MTAGRFLVACRLVNGKVASTTSPYLQVVIQGIVVIIPYLVESCLRGLRVALLQLFFLIPLS